MGLLRYLLLCTLAIAAVGCQQGPEPNFSPPQPHLKVVTYNVNWGMGGDRRILDFLDKSDADIVCLQETHRYWEAALLSRFGGRYPHRRFTEWGGAGGIAILSKHRLTDVKIIRPQAGWFPAILAVAQTPLGPIQFLNVHLHPPLSEKGSVSVSAYFSTSNTRLEEVKEFAGHVDMNRPLIVTGDFNEKEEGRAVRWLIDKGFADALSLYDTSTYTWSWTSYGITFRRRYDHIIFSKHLRCTGAKVTKIPASDHMPVEAIIVAAKRGDKSVSN